MSGVETPVPVHPKRAWWIPLLGVGSLGTGGLQALVGLGLIGVGLSAPGAARAVGRAVGSNRLALVIPCHRVVRSDGELGGYRWGTSKKKWLLDRER